ncbi:acetyl-CoA synthetase-like protein [Guyanagaster necrorhizus]|uniref:Acetyl-CoA synthetase-like protein n=1 Tax=Guyanagaster necrorhizus TaxID=856835 RepID=A0A9P8AMK5_9AGAR|nr:acetyl-CoA synthetase-like protein [Guyanagaster necrorhizus MCA 3950]KAG7440839.1 acetyl-CoA synthetase-like protein [Guyanagaster necrorhizus MCA 3950]
MASTALSETLFTIPDNLSVSQFMLDYQHPLRPQRGDTPCFTDDDSGQIVSFDQVKLRTQLLAAALNTRYNVYYAVATWSVHQIGGVVTPANPGLTPDELCYQLQITKASFIIVHSAAVITAQTAARKFKFPPTRIILLDDCEHYDLYSVPELISEALANHYSFSPKALRPGEGITKLALLMLSSGTTGKPKAVKIPHRAIIANLVQLAIHHQVYKYPIGQRRGFRCGDTLLGVLPFFHVAGFLLSMHFSVFCGMSVIVVGRYDFVNMLRSIVRYRITDLVIVPPQAVALCKHSAAKSYDMSTVKCVIVGAAPMTKEVNALLFDIFPFAQIGQAYGTTETPAVLANVSFEQQRGPVGSAGKLLPGVEARVVKFDGTFARPGEPGELEVRCPNMSLGYLDNEEATLETFRDGWLRTGDEVILTKDREVFIVDRIKEFIKVNGYQVAPAELEGCLLDHPDVIESCVIGVPHDYCGEVPLAFVALSSDANKLIRQNPSASRAIKQSILQHVASNKVNYKHLKGGVEFISEIPKNPSGKLLRRVLRQYAKSLRKREAKM